MTPKLRHLPGTPSSRYTDAHIRARSSVERAIGMLKGRWRCLRKERALHYSPEFAGKIYINIYIHIQYIYIVLYIFFNIKNVTISALIVNACCVVQNIAKFYNVYQPEIYLDEIDREERNIRIEGEAAEINGNEVREHIIRLYFN